MRRFVIIATLDGPVKPPVPLDDQGQIAAMRSEAFEREGSATVVWHASRWREQMMAKQANARDTKLKYGGF